MQCQKVLFGHLMHPSWLCPALEVLAADKRQVEPSKALSMLSSLFSCASAEGLGGAALLPPIFLSLSEMKEP